MIRKSIILCLIVYSAVGQKYDRAHNVSFCFADTLCLDLENITQPLFLQHFDADLIAPYHNEDEIEDGCVIHIGSSVAVFHEDKSLNYLRWQNDQGSFAIDGVKVARGTPIDSISTSFPIAYGSYEKRRTIQKKEVEGGYLIIQYSDGYYLLITCSEDNSIIQIRTGISG